MTRASEELQATIAGPQWQIAAANPLRLEAARQAAAHARQVAEAYAEGIGARLGDLLALSEPGTDPPIRSPRNMFGTVAQARSSGPAMAIEAGAHQVTAHVHASFSLEHLDRPPA